MKQRKMMSSREAWLGHAPEYKTLRKKTRMLLQHIQNESNWRNNKMGDCTC